MSLLSFISENALGQISNLFSSEKNHPQAEFVTTKEPTKPILEQLENNRLMILSKNFFESAWPALIGWTAGFCVTLYYIPQLIIANYLWAKMSIENNVIYPFPIPAEDIMNLIYLLFGFGTFHLLKKKLLK